jgi:two-component system LytT family response regulator
MCIYTADNTLILRETMKDLEKRLDPRRFQRVHRSTIVNLDQVKQVKPTPMANASWCWAPALR